MNNLKVGDKVRCIADITGGYAEVGAVGIIKNVYRNDYYVHWFSGRFSSSWDNGWYVQFHKVIKCQESCKGCKNRLRCITS